MKIELSKLLNIEESYELQKGNAQLKVTNENGMIYLELIDKYNPKEEYNKGYNRALSDVEHDILSKIRPL